MDNALLMRVLNSMANLNEQIETLGGIEMILVAILRDSDAADQFHHEIRATGIGRAGVEHLSGVRMIHHRECLALSFEPGDHVAGIHPEFDDLQRHPAPDRLGLFGDVHRATTALAELLANLVAPDY